MANSSMKIRAEECDVLLIVEQEVLRAGLRAILDRVGHVHSAVALDAVRELPRALGADGRPSVLIVDIVNWRRLGGMRELIAPGAARVIVVAGAEHGAHAGDLSVLPFDGILSADEISAETLGDALRQVLRGDLLLTAGLARGLVTRARATETGSSPRVGSLTSREMEALKKLAGGMSNKQIARALGITTHGVKRLVGSVLLKMGATNRTEAAALAIRSGIV
jgi:DNA-binding NarL/FixJ family response regulator